MFNIKYNLLVVIQIVLGILNYVLLVRVFGISVSSDAYLLTISSFFALTLFGTIPLSQIIPYYNDLKINSPQKAGEFYNSSLFFAFIIGILLFIFINIFINLTVKVFACSLDTERMMLFKSLLQIASFGFIFYPMNQVNEQIFNAEMRFAIPYTLTCIPTLFKVLTQVSMLFTHNYNISHLLYAQSIGFGVITIFGTLFIARNMIPFRLVFWTDTLKEEIKNSSVIKVSDVILSNSITALFNNFLALFPKGYISYYYYARKIMDIASTFAIGPSARFLTSGISKMLAAKNTEAIKRLAKKFLLVGGSIFAVALIITYFVQTPILKVISMGKLDSNDLWMISLFYLILCPQQIIGFIQSPVWAVTMQAKKAKNIFIINVLYLVIFAPIIYFAKPIFGVYTLSVAPSSAMLLTFTLYTLSAGKVLKDISETPKTEEAVC